MKTAKKAAPAKKSVAAKTPAKAGAKPAAKKAAKPVKKPAKVAAKVVKPAVKAAAPKAPAVKAGKVAKPAVKAAKAPLKGAKLPVVKAAPAKAGKAETAKPLDKKTDGKTGKVPAKKTEAVKAEIKVTIAMPEEPDSAEEVVLTDADGRRYCRVKDCDRFAEVDNYCRYHYILLWNNIQTRRHILQEGKLGRYIEELTARYPDKFLEILKKDLRNEKDFLAAIAELEIDESAVEAEYDDEESQSDIFEVQRMSDGGGSARSEEDDRF